MTIRIFLTLSIAAVALHSASLAYVDPQGRIVYSAAGAAPRVVGAAGYDVRLAPDGSRLVYTRLEKDMPRRTLVLWESSTGGSRDLVNGFVADPQFSSDGRRIAYMQMLKSDHHGWNLWTLAVDDPAKAARVCTREVTSLAGWTDGDQAVALVAEQNLLWIGLDGNVRRAVPLGPLYQKEFEWSGSDSLRLDSGHPGQVLLSAYRASTPPGALLDAGEPQLNSTLALFDLRSTKTKILLSPKAWGHDAVWSPDGWIYFTRLEPRRKYAVWRMHDDGSGLERVAAGSAPSVGR